MTKRKNTDDESAAVLAALAKYDTLVHLDLKSGYDMGVLLRYGLPPKLQKLRLAEMLPADLKIPDSVSSLRIVCDKAPTNLPSALTSLDLQMSNVTRERVVVPPGVRAFEVSAFGEPVDLVLPEGLHSLSLLHQPNVNLPERIPTSLRFLRADSIILPEEPNFIHHLELTLYHREGLDPNLVRKCPHVRVLRLECFWYNDTMEPAELLNALPLSCLEELYLRPGSHAVLDLSCAPVLRQLSFFGDENTQAELRACDKLTHLHANAFCVDLTNLPPSLEILVLSCFELEHCHTLEALARYPTLRSLEVHFRPAGHLHPQSWKWDVSALCAHLVDFKVAGAFFLFDGKTSDTLNIPCRTAAAKTWIGLTLDE